MLGSSGKKWTMFLSFGPSRMQVQPTEPFNYVPMSLRDL